MITARNLTKTFGRHRVLDGVDLCVPAGERVALLGVNGAGKTTLFRCLLGATRFQGQLTVGGHDVRTDGRAARTGIGYVPQRPPRFQGTLGDMVDFYCRLRDIPADRVASVLASVHLDFAQQARKAVTALSGGMLQKVLLALALAADVDVLLLDEPTANLDPGARRDLLHLLNGIAPEVTVLLSSHRLADIEAVAYRVLVLHDGGWVFDGSLDDMRGRLGRTTTLWVKVPGTARQQARTLLDTAGPAVPGSNGALGTSVERPDAADLIRRLREAGIPIENFWMESPSLEQQLETLVGGSRHA